MRRGRGVTGSITADAARAAVAAERMMVVEQAPPVLDKSEYGKMGGRGRKAIDIVKSFSEETGGGNSASYLAGKLKRDHPDIAAAVERGEYRII